jgi:type II secretory pathway pseudopilin PulG
VRISSPEYVVVAILVLVLLLLVAPAVLYKREQARQMLKQDRLKQVGMSLNNYHDTFNTFPDGSTAKNQPATRQPKPQDILISPL